MSILIRSLFLSVVLGALSHPALAAAEPVKCRYQMLGTLPLQYHGAGLELTMQGEINGTPAVLLIDTGASDTWLTRFGTDKRGLRRQRTLNAAIGVGGITRLDNVAIKSFKVGPIDSDGRGSLLVIDETGERAEYDAIVGASFLLQRDMELSLADKTIKFFEPHDCSRTFLGYWDSNAVDLPMQLDSDYARPVIDIEINGIKMKALMDTGATGTSISAAAARRAGVLLDGPGVTSTGPTSGVGKKLVNTYKATFRSVAIGHEVIKNPVLRITEQESEAFDVTLGTDFLRAHRVLFAVSQNKVYLSYVGGPPFNSGKLDPWVEHEAKGGNGYAQFRLAAMGLDSSDPAVQADARGWLLKAVAANVPLALRWKAQEHSHAGQHPAAVTLYEKLVSQDPHDMTAQLELFAMRLKAGQAEQAKPALAKAMAGFVWPTWPAPIGDYYLGRISLDALFKEARSDKDLAGRRQCEVLRHAHALQDALQQAAPAAELAARAKTECGVELGAPQ